MTEQLLARPPLPPTPELGAEAAIETRTAVDEQGYQRRVYDISPQLSVSFRGREELPTLSLAETRYRHLSVLTTDELPREVDQAEFQTYVTSHPEEEAGAEHLIANATPVGIIDLARRLNGRDLSPKQAEMRANFLAGKLGDQENALLDMMSAAIFTGESAGQAQQASDGLMDVVRAINGDHEIATALREKMKLLKDQEKHLLIREAGEDVLQLLFEHEPVDPEVIKQTEGLVLVRTTDNAPTIDDTDAVSMLPAAAYTRDIQGSADNKGYIPRYTTHFALNHYVQSHLMGNFDHRGFVVVAPLKSALEAGQRPTTLKGVDTYFTTGPGESVALPDAVIIQPGGDQAALVSQDGITKRYKSEGFQLEDLEKVLQESTDGLLTAEPRDKYSAEALLREALITAGYTACLISSDGMTSDIRDGKIIGEKQVVAEHSLEGLGAMEIASQLSKVAPEALDNLMAVLVKNLLVNATIEEEGGVVVRPSGTSNYIVEPPSFDKQIFEIAEAMHVKSGLHSDSFERQVEEAALIKLFGRELRESGNYDWQSPNKTVGEVLNSLLAQPDCPQRLRRAMIEAGLVTVRGGETERLQADREAEYAAKLAANPHLIDLI